MKTITFDLQRFAPPEPPSGGGGTPPGGGGSSSSVTYSAANSITSAGTYSNKTYTSSTADQNSVLVSLASGTVNLVNPTVTKSGDSDGGDNCNFYGINSGVMAMGGGTVSITGGTVTATAKGANGVFSYGGNGGQNGAAGDGTTVIISEVTINTTGDNGGGIMTTGGGVTKASNLIVTTTGNSSAPIRTDRGGGSVTVSGGSYTSSGVGSPAVYSTAEIVVENATLTSNHSEGVCIEGQNSVALTNCTLTVNNDSINGNATFNDAIMIYQSQSGDAADGTSTFTMTGGMLINKKGHVFHVTNTSAVINLNNVTIDDSGDGVLLSVCDDGWSGASNIANLNASAQVLTGDILVGDDSTLTLNITDGSTFTGNVSGSITNAKGSAVSTTVGTVNVSLDASSKWYLQEDTYITSFSGTAANVITGNYKLYVNNVALDGTNTSEDDGGDSSIISLTAGNDTYSNTVDGATIQGLASNDSIDNSGTSVSIDGGAGNDVISNSADNVTIVGGADSDTIINIGAKTLIDAGDGANYIYSDNVENVTIRGGNDNDSIINLGTNALLDGDDGDDYIYNAAQVDYENYFIITVPDNATINGGNGDDLILNEYGNAVLMNGGDGNDSIGSFGESVTINAGTGDDYIEIDGANVLINYTAGDGNDLIIGFNATSTLSIDEGTGSYSTQIIGDNIIITVGDSSIFLIDAANLSTVNIDGKEDEGETTLTLTDDSAAKVTLDTSIAAADASSRTTAIKLVGNGADNTILGGSGKDTLYGVAGDDCLVGGAGSDKIYGQDGNDTLWGGAGNDTLKGGDGDDLFIYSAGNDVIYDYAEGDVISLGAAISKSSFSGNNAILTIGSNKLTIKDAKGKELSLIEADGSARTVIGGASLLSDSSASKVTLKSSIAAADASARIKAIKLVGNALDNSIVGGSGNDTIYGGDGNDYLRGNAGSDKIYGQDGNDTLWGGAGNDTLKGGDGDDLFIYSAGNDVIYDYAAGDTISISAAISKSSFSGNNAILTIGSNKLTIKDAKGKELSLIEADGTERTIIGGASLLSDSSASKVTLKSSIAAADASVRTKAIKLVGNALDNTLVGGSGKDTLYGSTGADYLAGGAGSDRIYGQDGNDTLWGGVGNDTLKGGVGSDTYIYTAGKDVIYGFANDDMLQITETFTASLNAAGEVVFKVDSTASAITLKDFTAETFNINGDTYKISGKKLVPNS